MENLSNDLFKNLEADKIEQMNNILGGGGAGSVKTPSPEPGYSHDVLFENGNEVWYPDAKQ